MAGLCLHCLILLTLKHSSLTSSRYTVSRILAEGVDHKGDTIYLLEWEGYPITRSTWEPKVNLEDDGTLVGLPILLGALFTNKSQEDWESEKMRVANGELSLFDLESHLDQIDLINEEKADRKRRRAIKRARLQRASMSLTKTPHQPVLKHEHNESESESGSQASEADDEVEPLINAIHHRPSRPAKTRTPAAIENMYDTELNQRKKRKRQRPQTGNDESDRLSDDSLVQEALAKKKRTDERRSSIQDQPINPKDKGKAKAVQHVRTFFPLLYATQSHTETILKLLPYRIYCLPFRTLDVRVFNKKPSKLHCPTEQSHQLLPEGAQLVLVAEAPEERSQALDSMPYQGIHHLNNPAHLVSMLVQREGPFEAAGIQQRIQEEASQTLDSPM